MSARAEMELDAKLIDARQARNALEGAVTAERQMTVAFMDEALHHGWSWNRIGEALGVSATGARRHYERNRRKVRTV